MRLLGEIIFAEELHMETKPLSQSLSFWGLILAGLPNLQSVLPEVAALLPPHFSPWISLAGVILGTFGIKRRETTIKGVV